MTGYIFRRACLALLALAFACSFSSGSFAAEKQKYIFMAFSNPVPGKEAQFLEWYFGQHPHDVLGIEGITAAQLYKLSDVQNPGAASRPQKYVMMWEIETDDLAGVFARIKANIQSGKTVLSDAFDNPTYNNMTFTPISNRVTADEVRGKTVAEVSKLTTPK